MGADGQVATVLGPAGCGKTRLAGKFRRDAEVAGATVLADRCHDGESGRPFVLAADLLTVALSVCPELPARLAEQALGKARAAGGPADALPLAQEALALGRELGDQHRLAALHTNLADPLHAAGQRDTALVHLKEAARGFAAVDTGGTPRPGVWLLAEW